MKAMRQSTLLVVGSLLILLSISTIACSDKDKSSTKTSHGSAAGPASIFKKGKTYNIMLTTGTGPSKVLVVDIGPQPWVKVTMQHDPTEFWLNANCIVLATLVTETPVRAPQTTAPAAPPATSQAKPQEPIATSKPALPVIDTGEGNIPLEAGADNIPADGLKEIGAICHRYMVKRGNSWFMCLLTDNKKQVLEYREVRATVSPKGFGMIGSEDKNGVTEADRLNGYQWRGFCICRCAAMRKYADGKWQEWTGGTTLFWEDVNKKDGVWEMPIKFLPTSEWSVPEDTK